jgi:tetratricopeptide (TPR) repeat protein
MKQYKKALIELQRALELDPKNEEYQKRIDKINKILSANQKLTPSCFMTATDKAALQPGRKMDQGTIQGLIIFF